MATQFLGTPSAFCKNGVTASFAAASVVTDGNGQASVYVSGTQASAFQAQASIDGVVLQTPIGLVAGQASALHSSRSVMPVVATADGLSVSVVSLVLRDQFDDLVPGVSAILSSSVDSTVFTSPVHTSDPSGAASTSVRSTKAETKQVRAAFASRQLMAAVNFVPGPINKAFSFFSSLATAVADGNAVAVLRFIGRDRSNHATTGRTISASITNGVGELMADTVTSDANGVAEIALVSTVAGIKTVITSADGTSFAAATTFVPGPPDAGHSGFTVSPNQISAGQTKRFTATFRDAFDNPTPKC